MNHPLCGSMEGYRRHAQLRESTCQPCCDAQAEYMRAWRITQHKVVTAQVHVTQVREILVATPELRGLITRALGPRVVSAIEAL